MHTLQQSYGRLHFPAQTKKSSWVHRFWGWCRSQEKNRLLWLAVMITAHGCAITPITIGFVMFAGNSFVFWPWIIAAMSMSLVTNLAALPTKITIPIFLLSIIIDVIIIANCIAIAIA